MYILLQKEDKIQFWLLQKSNLTFHYFPDYYMFIHYATVVTFFVFSPVNITSLKRLSHYSSNFKLVQCASAHGPVVTTLIQHQKFLNRTVLCTVRAEADIGLAASLRPLGLTEFPLAFPTLSQWLHEQGERGEEITQSSQVEGTVVGLGVVIEETWETSTDTTASS